MRGLIQFLSLCDWLISLSMMSSKHVSEFLSLLKAELYSVVCIHLPADLLAIVDNAAMAVVGANVLLTPCFQCFGVYAHRICAFYVHMLSFLWGACQAVRLLDCVVSVLSF